MKQQLKKDAEASKKNKEDAKAELKRNMAVLETSRKAKKKNNSAIADGTEGQSMAAPSDFCCRLRDERPGPKKRSKFLSHICVIPRDTRSV